LPDDFDDTTMVDAPSTPASAIQYGKLLHISCSNASANGTVLTRQGADSDSVPAEHAAPAPITVALDAPSNQFDDEPVSSPISDSLSISSKFNAPMISHAACQARF
jgi:hypothetical protein